MFLEGHSRQETKRKVNMRWIKQFIHLLRDIFATSGDFL